MTQSPDGRLITETSLGAYDTTMKGEQAAAIDAALVVDRTREGLAIDDALVADQARQSTTIDTKVSAERQGGGGADSFIAKMEMKAPTAVVAVLGDSTGNDANEWVRLSLAALGVAYPASTLVDRVWNDGATSYGSPVTVQTGVALTFRDTFTRTGVVIGSLPDVGGAWFGDAGADGHYTLDGTKLAFTGTALASFFSYAGAGAARASCNFTFSEVQSNTSIRLYGQYKDASNFVAIFITFGASITWTITKKIAGAFGTVATGTVNPFAPGGATFAASITVNGTAVSALVNGVALSGTLLAGDVTAMTAANPGTGVGFNVVGGSVADYQVELIGGASLTQVASYNGSVPGTPIATSLARLPGILPVAPDVVIISHSHNQGTDTPAVFTAKLVELVDAVLALHPDAGIVLSSQNPRVSPAMGIAEHAARMVAARTLARRRGWGYIAVTERFAQQANVPALMDSDGVHPKDPVGRVLWTDSVTAYYDSLRLAL